MLTRSRAEISGFVCPRASSLGTSIYRAVSDLRKTGKDLLVGLVGSDRLSGGPATGDARDGVRGNEASVTGCPWGGSGIR